VTEARRLFDGLHYPGEGSVAAFNARLLVSELVGNSVRHAGLAGSDLITLEVCCEDGLVRVEVSDLGPGFTPRDRAALAVPTPTGGRGLFLVDALSDRWGVSQPRPDRPAMVWFEIDVDG
jgi:anti-sigma regulatory factor (Ser/Thr protein kinase)